jgi:hypothetical protein
MIDGRRRQELEPSRRIRRHGNAARRNRLAGRHSRCHPQATAYAREGLGINGGVDKCSAAYRGGELSDLAFEVGTMGLSAGMKAFSKKRRTPCGSQRSKIFHRRLPGGKWIYRAHHSLRQSLIRSSWRHPHDLSHRWLAGLGA